ncbi:MAG: FAD-dependent oxidoreductase [Clostridia bacterium]
MRTEPIAPSLRVGRGRPDPAELIRDREPQEALAAELKPPLSDLDALAEAYRCLECGTADVPAPCQAACPALVDVPGFVGHLARGEPGAAARVILAANPLGASCARVCPTEILCEGACVLNTVRERPVDIGRLQRYALDRAFADPATLVVDLPKKNGFRIAVIGAGPAGLAAAAFLETAGFRVTVYDERSQVGGLVRYAIAPYRLWSEPLPEERAWLEGLGIRFKLGHPIENAAQLRGLEADYDAIVLAVGLGPDVDVRYPGDELPGVFHSLPFIEAVKGGDPPAIGTRVAVIGGGNTAIDVAREARRLGAADVTVVYRRTEAEMPAYPEEVAEARREGIHFHFLANPIAFLGTDRVETVVAQVMRLGEADASGRRRPEPVPGETVEIPVDTVVKAIGQEPRLPFLSQIPGLQVQGRRIVVDARNGATTHPRYFAAGDAVNGGDTVVAAVQLGKVAARGVMQALLEGRRP